MKKKIVVKMMLDSEESCREAMKLSVKVNGVTAVNLDRDKGQITVTGENVDPVAVAKALKGDGKLRKLLRCVFPNHDVRPVDLVTVEDVKEEKKEEKKPDEKKPEPWVWPPYCYPAPPVFQLVEGSQPGTWWC